MSQMNRYRMWTKFTIISPSMFYRFTNSNSYLLRAVFRVCSGFALIFVSNPIPENAGKGLYRFGTCFELVSVSILIFEYNKKKEKRGENRLFVSFRGSKVENIFNKSILTGRMFAVRIAEGP